MSQSPIPDYSLVGETAKRAAAQGLAGATWYTTPVPRQKMRELLERRDGPAVRDTLLWFALLVASGALGFVLWGSWWAAIPFAIYGVIYASSSDSRWHEAGHGTAFKTDWMNNALYEIASFMVCRESTPWRWSHTRHHSDTIIVGRDPEIAVPRPPDIAGILMSFFNLKGVPKEFGKMLLHCTGRLTAEEQTYIPEFAQRAVFFKARIYVLIYFSVVGLAVYTGSILPLMYVGLPNFYGSWLMVVYGLTQHAGLAENVLDHRLNCRTVYLNRVHRYLYWNMNYHAEHHMFPLVPYHALPRLHALVKHDMPRPYAGLLEAYREIVPTLLRQMRDPTFHVQRVLPETAGKADERKAFSATGACDADGWIAVCAADLLQQAEVVRFDWQDRTFTVYRTVDDGYYATDGMCTHGNAHLSKGLVLGNQIECPKHNGRFDIRDGSPQRLPACLALKTYPVRISEGELFLNVKPAAGLGGECDHKTLTEVSVNRERR